MCREGRRAGRVRGALKVRVRVCGHSRGVGGGEDPQSKCRGPRLKSTLEQGRSSQLKCRDPLLKCKSTLEQNFTVEVLQIKARRLTVTSDIGEEHQQHSATSASAAAAKQQKICEQQDGFQVQNRQKI